MIGEIKPINSPQSCYSSVKSKFERQLQENTQFKDSICVSTRRGHM